MQVTRSNFRAALPSVKAALAECQFFAFDCEMTGLTLEGGEDKWLDDVHDRWRGLLRVGAWGIEGDRLRVRGGETPRGGGLG
jgi:hypothetical protein